MKLQYSITSWGGAALKFDAWSFPGAWSLAGVSGAMLTSRTLSTLLFQTNPSDPETYAVVALLLTAVALLASYLPARRAMSVNPIVALRAD